MKIEFDARLPLRRHHADTALLAATIATRGCHAVYFLIAFFAAAMPAAIFHHAIFLRRRLLFSLFC